MEKLKVLNRKEIKQVYELVKHQWDAEVSLDYVFLQNTKDKIYLVTREVFGLPLDKLRINSVGMYFGEVIKGKELRLSIEGSQLIGPSAKLNVVEISRDDAFLWLKGNEIVHESAEKGFVIIKSGNDYLGCGKAMGDKILNYIPKARRINLNA